MWKPIVFLTFMILIACGNKTENEEVANLEQPKIESQKKSDKTKKTEWENISKEGVSLTYPSDWKLDDSGKLQTTLAIYPISDLAESGFKDNINLSIRNAPSNFTLDKWGEMIDEGNKKRDGYELLKSNKKTLKGSEILNLEYKVKRESYDLKFKQYFIIKNGKAYNLTFAADKKTYNKNIIKVIRLFNSIKIEDNNSSKTNKTLGSMKNKEQSGNWKTFRKSDISIDFPDDWKVDESSKEKIVLIAFPKAEKTSTGFRANLNVVIQNDSKGELTTDYWATAIDQGNKKNENYKLIKSQDKKVGDLDVHELEFKLTRQGYNLRYLQYLIVKNKKAYNLTFTAEQTAFVRNIESVKEIFDSFKITS